MWRGQWLDGCHNAFAYGLLTDAPLPVAGADGRVICDVSDEIFILRFFNIVGRTSIIDRRERLSLNLRRVIH